MERQYTASRKVRIAGTNYSPGEALSAEALKSLPTRNLDALISGGFVSRSKKADKVESKSAKKSTSRPKLRRSA